MKRGAQIVEYEVEAEARRQNNVYTEARVCIRPLHRPEAEGGPRNAFSVQAGSCARGKKGERAVGGGLKVKM
jgi:hypothetical protein